MRQHDLFRRALAALLCLLLVPRLAVIPARAAGETVTIRSARDLLELADSCTLDTSSQGKTVRLAADISLDSVDFTPIPSFGGEFDGGGHTISGLTLRESASPTGLFGTVQDGAVVRDLHVRGSVAPGGSRSAAGGIAGENRGTIQNCTFSGTVSGADSIGGIAGVNAVTGTIRSCTAQGSITGKSMTGGIAGQNLGVISGCRNDALVNITKRDPGLDPDELDLGADTDLGTLRALDTVNVTTDAGGIAGCSSGMILSCTNTAVIGYQHIGYNVGGIAGRSSGHIANCENKGAVFGRKDIGGIVGQAEPDIVLTLSAGQVENLRTQLDRLQDLVDKALVNAQDSGDDISSRLGEICGTVDGAVDHAQDLGRQLSDFGDSTTAEINRVGGILSDAAGRLDTMSGDASRLSEDLTQALDALAKAVELLGEAEPPASAALGELQGAADGLRQAKTPLRQGMEQMGLGIDLLQNAAGVKDAKKLRAAEKQLGDGLDSLAQSAQAISDAFGHLANALGSNGLGDAGSAARDLSAACSRMASGLGRVGQGAEDLLNAVQVEDRTAVDGALKDLRSGVSECVRAGQDAANALDELIRALQSPGGDTSAALEKLTQSAGALSAGMEKVSQALDTLEQNISIDNEKARAALDTIRSGLETFTQGTENAAKALDRLEKALNAADTEEIAKAVDELDAALSQVSGAMGQINSGIQGIRDNLSLTPGAANGGVDEVQSGMEALLAAVDELDGAVAEFSGALDSARQAGTALESGTQAISTALELFRGASASGTGVLQQAGDLFDYLSGVDPIQITYPAGEINTAADGLFDSIKTLSGQMDALNSRVNAASGGLGNDLLQVSAQLRLTSDTLLNALQDAENGSLQGSVSDTSEEDIDAVTSGKILSCVNRAAVRGDINVGGVAGAMAVEYELDPEDDLSTDAPAYRRAYELKAILHKCANYGSVTSLRNYAGGVCGRADLGLVSRCGGYGSVESESGDYVGGVAGFTGGAVRNCFAKCRLSGGDYVGGITGAVEKDGGGSVSRCCSLVQIPEHGQYAGAISGGSGGTFQDNLFVSDGLAGLDRVSLAGQAQAVDYAQLLQAEDLPAEFRQFTLRFVAGETVVKETTFHYGDSFGPEVYPELPPREGCFAAWDTQELEELRFDTDVTAVYTPYITTLAGGGYRDDGRPVFLGEGEFSAAEDFTARRVDLDAEETEGLSLFSRRALLETWELSGAGTVRYLSPTGSTDALELYIRDRAGWRKLDADAAGSYLLCQIPNGTATLAAVSCTPVWWIWLLAAVLAAGIVLGISRYQKRRRRKRKAQPVQEAPPAGPDQGQEDGKRHPRALWAALAAVLCVAAIGALLLFGLGLKDDLAAYHLLKKYINQEELDARLSVDVQVGELRHHLETSLTRTQAEGKRVTRAQQYGASVYYCDGLLYLENGHPLEAGGVFPDYPSLMSGVLALYRDTDISVFDNPGKKIYRVQVDGDAAQSVLENLFPSSIGRLTQVERLDMDLVEQGGELAQLRFDAAGALDGAGPVAVSAVLESAEEAGQGMELPLKVREQLTGGGGAEPAADQALMKLLEAWLELNVRDPLGADVALTADCGPLILDEELAWTRSYAGGVEINSIRKNGRTYYISAGGVYDETGSQEGVPGELCPPDGLLALAYQLCLNGTPRCAQAGESCTYTLELDKDGIARMAGTILPEARDLALTFHAGTIEVVVSGDRVERLNIACGGTVQLAMVDVPMSLGVRMDFTAPAQTDTPAVPDDVLDVIDGMLS